MSKIKDLLKKDTGMVLGSLALLLGSLLPLLVIGKYNVMSADDYSLGYVSNKIWLDTHSIGAMFEYAVQNTMNWYQTWQGSFSMVFLNSWNPGFFHADLVWITPLLMLFFVVLSRYIFVKALITKIYTDCHKEVLVVWALFTFLTLQTLPSPVEGIYWFSGAMGYTLLHSCMLMFIAFSISVEDIKGKAKVVSIFFLFVCAFFVGGSQYITAMQCVLWYVVCLVLDYKKINWWKIGIFLSLMMGFVFNIAAPGNGVRKASSAGVGAVEAIIRSFVEAIRYAKEWISPLLVCTILCMVPFIWQILKKAKKELKYPYPIVVTLFTYCIFAAAFTPALYGVGNVDAGRIQNLIQGIFYIAVLVNVFYYIGWLQYKMMHSEKEIFADISAVKNILVKYQMFFKWAGLALVMLVFIGTADKNQFASMSALRSLVSGEAGTYYAEAQVRQEIYLDESVTIAEVKAFSVKPKVLYFSDIVVEGDVNYWINEHVARYYGKEKVILKVENNEG